MAVAADSYSDAGEVAVDVPAYTTSAGVFDASTNPTITTVEAWIDEVSDAINLLLDDYGQTVPATDRMATALGRLVRREVADRVRVTRPNSDRRPRTGQQQGDRTRTPFDAVEAAERLIKRRAWGNSSLTDYIDYRDTDESGDETAPIFQREAFGNEFTDWDSD